MKGASDAPESVRTRGEILCCEPNLDPPGEETLDVELELVGAVASSTRLRVLRTIANAEHEVCVCELEPVLDVSQGAISQALGRLVDAGLLHRRKAGRWRYYRLSARGERLLEALARVRETANV